MNTEEHRISTGCERAIDHDFFWPILRVLMKLPKTPIFWAQSARRRF